MIAHYFGIDFGFFNGLIVTLNNQKNLKRWGFLHAVWILHCAICLFNCTSKSLFCTRSDSPDHFSNRRNQFFMWSQSRQNPKLAHATYTHHVQECKQKLRPKTVLVPYEPCTLKTDPTRQKKTYTHMTAECLYVSEIAPMELSRVKEQTRVETLNLALWQVLATLALWHTEKS